MNKGNQQLPFSPLWHLLYTILTKISIRYEKFFYVTNLREKMSFRWNEASDNSSIILKMFSPIFPGKILIELP